MLVHVSRFDEMADIRFVRDESLVSFETAEGAIWPLLGREAPPASVSPSPLSREDITLGAPRSFEWGTGKSAPSPLVVGRPDAIMWFYASSVEVVIA